MSKKTLLLLLACLGLVGVAVAATRRPEKGEITGVRPRPIPPVPKGAIADLKITFDGKTTRITKRPEVDLPVTWVIAEPLAAAADEAAAKTAVEKLEQLEFGHVVTDLPAKHADLELTDDKATRVVASGADGKPLADLLIGKSVGAQTMVRLPGKNEVWQAQGSLKYVFGKDTKTWRNKTLLQIKRDEVTEVVLETPDGKAVIEHAPAAEGKPEKWAVKSASVPIAKLDESTAAGIVSAMTALRAADFADGVSAADAGLEGGPAGRRIAVKTKDGKEHAVRIGKAKGDDYYMQVVGNPQPFLVRKFGIEKLLVKPIELRDKSIADIKSDEVKSLEIKHGDVSMSFERSGEDLRLVKPKQDVDAGKVIAMTSLFTGFKGYAFADTTDPKVTGLGKPSLTATVKTKAGQTLVLLVGSPTKEAADYYAQVKGKPEVYLLRKFMADRLRKKPDELKSDGPKGPPGKMPPGMPPGMAMPPGHP